MKYNELYDEYNALLSMRSENLSVLSTLKDGYISTKTIAGKRGTLTFKKRLQANVCTAHGIY